MKFLKNKLAVTIIVLSVTFLGIIFYSVKSGSSNFVSNGVNEVLNPIQKITYSISNKIKNSLDFVFSFQDVVDENDRLKKENIELKNKLIAYEDYKRENEEFRSVLEFENQSDAYKYVGVNIIGRTGGSFFDGYVIDKGTNDGIQKDMAVVAPDGLVGIITEANTNSAKVQPIVSENTAVAGLVQSTRESTGIVRGYRDYTETPLAKIYYLPVDSDIKEGDVIVTSGLGNFYPKGLRIGEVVSIEEDKVKVNKNATIKPYVDFSKLEELFIVVPKDVSEGIKYME